MKDDMLYKDVPPQETISKIKGILSSLGIRTREIQYDAGGLFYSCRIEIDNFGLEYLSIGTNGKGMTRDYATASGYAELMERLQNKFLVNEAMRYADQIPDGKFLSFRFFPDEKSYEYSINDFLALIRDLFPNYDIDHLELFCNKLKKFPYQCSTVWWKKSAHMNFLGIPFARFKRNENLIETVPIVLARANSSTGLCAGNTPWEAIMQGINEVFERYVLQRIYLDNITPPSFPDGYFEGSKIADRLRALKAEGYIYDIKDMSLGKGFPVVGIILTNTTNGTVMFRMGADLSLEIALERCLTEIFQGRVEGKRSRFIEYSIHECVNMDTDKELRKNEYLKNLKDGTGMIPKSLFMDEPTYYFSEPTLQRNGQSKEDLNRVFQFLFDRGYEILIRDNSFLGFCTYHVIIPGLSDQNYELRNILQEYFASFSINIFGEQLKANEGDNLKQWALYNVKAEKDVRDFVHNHYPNDDTLHLAPYCVAPQNIVNKHLLLFLSAVKNNDYKDANRHFKRLMQQRQEQKLPYNEYMACIGSYVYHKSLGHDETELRAWLRHLFSEETIQEVTKDFSLPENIMINYSFPTCFDCHVCPVSAECHYRDAIGFEERIQNLQMANPIDQTRLFELFN